MSRTKIEICSVGHQKFPFSTRILRKWKSELFEVTEFRDVQLLPNSDGDDYTYSDESIANVFPVTSTEDSIQFGICSVPLADSFYLRPLSEHSCILSLSELGLLLQAQNRRIEDFILKNLYLAVGVHALKNSIGLEQALQVVHDESRGCIFDMNPNRADAVFSMERLSLCADCKAKLQRASLPHGFLEQFEREIRRIRPSLYQRIEAFVKKQPLVSILVAVVVGLSLELLGNFVYDWLRGR